MNTISHLVTNVKGSEEIRTPEILVCIRGCNTLRNRLTWLLTFNSNESLLLAKQ